MFKFLRTLEMVDNANTNIHMFVFKILRAIKFMFNVSWRKQNLLV